MQIADLPSQSGGPLGILVELNFQHRLRGL